MKVGGFLLGCCWKRFAAERKSTSPPLFVQRVPQRRVIESALLHLPRMSSRSGERRIPKQEEELFGRRNLLC